MPTATRPPSSSDTTHRPAAARDPLIDGLRSIALARVLLWHAFAAAWLSWIFPAMPVMFFLAGSVLAGSAGGTTASGPGDRTHRLVRRAGRILIPFWVYSAAVLAILLLGGTVGDGPTGGWRQALSLVVPLHDTSGTDRDWLTGHLWYLTDYLVLLVVLPAAVRLARRPVALVVGALLGLLALELAPVFGLPPLTGGARVAAGDLLCYGLFAALGIAWATRRAGPATTRSVPALAAGGVALVAAALAAGTVVPLPRGSLNESYLLLTVAGLGWLLLLGAAQRPLRRWAGRPAVATATRAVSARALTIYLWHPAAILVSLALVSDIADGPVAVTAMLTATLLLTAAAVLAFGWVEDLAARRPPRWRPVGRSDPAGRIALVARVLVAATTVTVGAVAVTAALDRPDGTATAAIPRPSDRTALADTAFAATTREPALADGTAADRNAGGTVDGESAGWTDEATGLPTVELQAALEQWIADRPDVDNAVTAVASGSRTWAGSGVPPDGEPPAAAFSTGMASLTKTFTAALVVRAAAEGQLDLDAPVPDLPGVAPLPEGATVTARQLLQHSTGLVQYTDAAGYDPARPYTAAELVSLSTQAPRAHPADAGVTYSNSNYLWLGLLLESMTGESYADLVAGRLAGPLGLASLEVPADGRSGWVGGASGGVTATPVDVARFFDALVDRDEVLPADGLARMTDLNHLNGGLGIWPLCPCGESPEDGKWATGLGHYVGDGAAFAFPDDRLAVYVRIVGADIGAERMIELRDELLLMMRDTARASAADH